MDNQGIVSVPGQIPDILSYIDEKKNDFRNRRRRWFTQPLETYEYPPDHWSPDTCMLARFPAELVFMVIEDLYQADLYHLALTCRRMADCTLSTLYIRDITRFGCIALRWACTFGIIPTLERTLRYGAPADYFFPVDSALGCKWIIGGHGYRYEHTSALVTAIVADEPEAVRILCARGAYLNEPHPTVLSNGFSIYLYPIHYALGDPSFPVQRRGVRQGNPEIVRILLDAGADPNEEATLFVRGPHATPLFLAMQSNVPAETVRILLDRGADPLVPVAWPFNAVDQALLNMVLSPYVSNKRLPLQLLLLPERPGSDWPWGLNWEKVKMLVAYGGADGGNQEIHGSNPKIWPTYPLLYNNLDSPHVIRLARLILAQGADLADWTRRCGISPIQAVIWWAEARSRVLIAGDMELIPQVLDRMCELVTMMGEASLTPSKPTRKDNPVVLRSTIIDSPMWVAIIGYAGVQKIAKSHPTPLSYVCSPFRFFGATRLIPILLKYGADINARCSAGVTALHHAVMFNGNNIGTALRLLVGYDGGPSRSGLNINAQDGRGWTPLHYACHFGFRQRQADQADAVRILLDNGADIHARSYSDVTPLLLAVWCCNVPVVKLLLDRGASKEDLALLPGQPMIPYTPMVDHETFLFDYARLDGKSWANEEWEISKSIVEIYDLIFPILFPTGKSCNIEEQTINNIYTNILLSPPPAPPPPPLPPKTSSSKDNNNNNINKNKNNSWVPPGTMMARIFEPCVAEIRTVTQDRFEAIKFNTPHKAWERAGPAFPSFDVTVYTIEVLSYVPYKLLANTAPWTCHSNRLSVVDYW